MATGWRVYTSNDTSAPQLYGNNGGLLAVLDGVMAGYGSMAALGASPGAGAWATTFTATNKRVYRPSAGARLYVRFNDAGAGTGGAQEALIKGAESFSDIDTPTNPMPTTAQSSLTQNSLIIRKSATADGTTGRAWIVAGDDRTVMMFIATGDSANKYHFWYWGDFFSNGGSSDAYRVCVIARPTENSNSMVTTAEQGDMRTSFASAITGHFVQRSDLGTGTALTMGKNLGANDSSGTTAWVGSIPYPNRAGSYFLLEPVLISHTTAGGVRGRLRGFWYTPHSISALNDGDTLSGTGDLAGKTFRVIKQSGNAGVYVIETSDTVEAN